MARLLSPCTKRTSETKFDWQCMPYARDHKGIKRSEDSFDWSYGWGTHPTRSVEIGSGSFTSPKAMARFRGTHPTRSVEIGSGSFTSPKAMARFRGTHPTRSVEIGSGSYNFSASISEEHLINSNFVNFVDNFASLLITALL